MKQPSAAAIAAAVPLTKRPERGADPILVCSICGVAVDPADLASEVWREHDVHDRPLAGHAALIFVGQGNAHEACRKQVEAHPRLYAHETGRPGHFPFLCGPCVHRNGFDCRNRDLKANGGAGLHVSLDSLFANAIVCMGGGRRYRPVPTATKCAGRELTQVALTEGAR